MRPFGSELHEPGDGVLPSEPSPVPTNTRAAHCAGTTGSAPFEALSTTDDPDDERLEAIDERIAGRYRITSELGHPDVLDAGRDHPLDVGPPAVARPVFREVTDADGRGSVSNDADLSAVPGILGR